MNTTIRILCALLGMALVAGCGRKEEPPAGGLLDYVPADTPYVFAGLEPAPEDLIEKMREPSEKLMASYRKMIATAVENDPDAAQLTEENRALLDRVMELASVDGIEASGIGLDATYVLYGNGLLPVLRVRVADGEKLEATIAGLEEDAGARMQTAEIGGQSYRYAGDDRVRVLIAIAGDELVVSVAPAELTEAALRSLLGLTRPTSPLSDTDRLEKLAADYGFVGQGMGYVDIVRLVETFVGEPSAADAELLGLMEHDADALGEACKAEYRALAGIMPRAVVGYTRMDTERLETNTVLELREDLATAYSTLGAPVPGLGEPTGGVFDFGFSLDLVALRTLLEARIGALEAAPYECEALAGLNEIPARAERFLNQPLPPMVYNLRGANIVLESIEGLNFGAAAFAAPEVHGRALIAMESAPDVIAMGQMMLPGLGALEIEPNGEPVTLPPGSLPNVNQPLYLALSENGLALTLREEDVDELPAMLQGKASRPYPVLSLGYDFAAYMRFVGSATKAAADDEGDDTKDAQDAAQAMAAAEMMQGMTEALGAVLGYVGTQFVFTERGLEVRQQVVLPD